MNTYTIGTTVTMSAEFRDSDSVLFDPEFVNFVGIPPGAAPNEYYAYAYETDLELIRDDVGKYHVDIVIDVAGKWSYEYYSTGDGVASQWGEFFAGTLPTAPGSNEIDLTCLSAVKRWAEIKGDTDDADIQDCITAFSKAVMERVGRETLSVIKTFTDIYNGNNSVRLFLNNFPIVELISVYVNGVSLPISTDYFVTGVFIDQSLRRNSIAYRTATGGVNTFQNYPSTLPGYGFTKGIGNVRVTYKAGYKEAEPGFEYTATPYDLELAVRKAVALQYKRRAWQDLRSKSISASGGSGTTTYRDWEIPPEIDRVLVNYTRGTY
jgi:hypothetical protein